MTYSDIAEVAYDSAKRRPEGVSAEAGLALGFLMGSWKAVGPGVRNLFALGLVRRCVSTALRAEGYNFLPEHFSYWLAGAVVLDAARPPLARPARLVSDLVLSALARSRCEEIVRAAELFGRMAMPIADLGEHGDIGQCHEALDAARAIALRSRFAGGRGPAGVAERLASAAQLARAAPALATRLAADRPFDLQGRWAMVRDEPERAAYWTLDLEVEGYFADAIPGMPPLPCPGLFDRAWLQTDIDGDATSDMSRASTRLTTALGEIMGLMEQAIALDRECSRVVVEVSAKSRLPQVVGLLGIMEQLRSSQIEAALGVTRIGVRGIIENGVQLGAVRQRKSRGLNMIEMDTSRRERLPLPSRRAPAQPTEQESKAIAEVDDALAYADKILSKFADRRDDQTDTSDDFDDWDR